MNATTILSFSLVIVILNGARASESAKPPVGAPSAQHGGHGAPVFDDAQIKEQLIEAGEKLIKSGDAVEMQVLYAQVKRARCGLDLPRASRRRLSVEEIGERCRESVIIVGSLYNCGKCAAWHLDTGTGFIMSESGVIATCYHVVNVPTHKTIIAMTHDGRVFPVKEILAADETNDIAILRIEARGLRAAALSTQARVGSRVFVIGHPEQKFYTLTEGIVSRYFTGQEETGDATMMSITADFGLGSSGCPIFNEYGAVVGMADNIVSSLSEIREGKAKAGIVFKHCRPSAAILELIHPNRLSGTEKSQRRLRLARD